MKSGRFSIIIIFRVILISLNCFLVLWLFMYTSRPATTLFAAGLLILQVISLISYHTRILRDLSNFLIYLEENDTTLVFSNKRIERHFKGLVFQLNKINHKLQAARLEKERQFQYLQSLVKQIDTGIIAYDLEGKIEIYNRAARELLGIRSPAKISTLIEAYPDLEGFINPGRKAIASPLKIITADKENMLAVKVGSLRFDTRIIRLISLQNIKPELEAKELDAWRKLIRIQRHEIINSITPILTLTTAVKRRFLSGGNRIRTENITEEHIDDALNSMEVIEERSRGLIDFIERVRGLTDIPGLKLDQVGVKKLFDQIALLFSRELSQVRFVMEISPEDLTFKGDERLLEQVFINLLKNSLEAIRNPGGQIRINATRNHGNLVFDIIDNGIGVEKEALESIFVPAYTTKEYGSGIGLSIARQIIQLHKGTINVRSIPGVETVFEIVLPG